MVLLTSFPGFFYKITKKGREIFLNLKIRTNKIRGTDSCTNKAYFVIIITCFSVKIRTFNEFTYKFPNNLKRKRLRVEYEEGYFRIIE